MDINQLQSPQINELVAALVAAKKEFKPLRADVKGNYGEYASSDAIKEATEEALGIHGLVFIQHRIFVGERIFLQSKIMHSSGQWLAAYMPITILENVRSIDQAYGSATTYQRRYEAYGMLGLGKGDGMDPDSEPEEQSRQRTPSKPVVASEEQVKDLSKLLVGKDDIRQALLRAEGVESLKQLSFDLVSKSITKLKG
jgi:hypothetical protein